MADDKLQYALVCTDEYLHSAIRGFKQFKCNYVPSIIGKLDPYVDIFNEGYIEILSTRDSPLNMRIHVIDREYKRTDEDRLPVQRMRIFNYIDECNRFPIHLKEIALSLMGNYAFFIWHTTWNGEQRKVETLGFYGVTRISKRVNALIDLLDNVVLADSIKINFDNFPKVLADAKMNISIRNIKSANS